YLPPTSWLRFAAWLNCGFVVYVGYGVIHSRLTGRQLSRQPAEHDAYAAYVGAWLALIGMTLLFCTRGFDLWLEAFRKPKEVAGFAQAGAALAEILRPEPWLAVSWFLILPLLLTGFVLCPLTIRRALRVKDATGNGYKRETTLSLTVASVVEVIIIIYLWF